jgi:hypothetical protein
MNGSTVSSQSNVLNAPVKPTQVSEEIIALRNNVNMLNEILGTLYSRLSPVIRQEDLVPPPSQADKAVVSLAGEIRVESSKINSLVVGASAILQRLEI